MRPQLSLPNVLYADMRLRDSLIGQLLKHVAAPGNGDPPIPWRLDGVPERQFQWLMAAGLGPLLYRTTRERTVHVPTRWRDVLLGADLTAQVRHASLADTACDVITRCAQAGIDVVLLKGISTSEEFYPAPHLRPMGDVDLLVPAARCHAVEKSLLEAGYRKHPDHPETFDLHHGAPLHEPRRDVWVEIHRSLYPEGDEFASRHLFSAAAVMANVVKSTFRGLPVLRLCPELQLAYIASSWMRDITVSRIQASFLASLVDALYLLKRGGAALDWQKLERWTDDDLPTASLYVLLTYLASRGLSRLPLHVTQSLAGRQTLVGALQLHIIHAMIDRHLVGGVPWLSVLPPPVAGRYSFRRQWTKRVVNRCRTGAR